MQKQSSRRSSRWWGQLIAQYEEGQETLAETCRAAGVSVASFYYWRRRLQQEQPGFIELGIGTSTTKRLGGRCSLELPIPAGQVLQVTLPCGWQLCIPADLPREQLALILSTLKEVTC
jgi:hypothetical protein